MINRRVIGYTILCLVFYTLFYISVANAAPLVKIERVGRKATEKTNTVIIIGVEDNQDGTTTMIVGACGSTLHLTYKDKDAEERPEAVVKEIGDAVEKACK